MRAELLQKRQQLDPLLREQYNAMITQRFIEQHPFNTAQHLAIYWPHRGEVNTHDIVKYSWNKGWNCYLPVVEKNAQLSFVPYTESTLLKKNRYDIPEPLEKNKIIEPSLLDIAIVPLIGFTENGARLGTGAGYYDRAFAFRLNVERKKPLLIGLAYECQKIEELQSQPWDVPMDKIITEKMIYTPARK